MAADDSMDDDVFEALDDTANSKLRVLEDNCKYRKTNSPSSTGYRDYKPPAEVLRLCETDILEDTEQIIHKVKLSTNFATVE